MEEKDLVELGLLAKGDRIKLNSFCKKGISSDREEKIARIKQILGQGKGKKLLVQLSVPRHPENRQEHLASSTRSAGSTGNLAVVMYR